MGVTTLSGNRVYDGTSAIHATDLTVDTGMLSSDGTVTVTSGSGTLSGRDAKTQTIIGFGNLKLSDPNYTLIGATGSVTIKSTSGSGGSGGEQPSNPGSWLFDPAYNGALIYAEQLIGDIFGVGRRIAPLSGFYGGLFTACQPDKPAEQLLPLTIVGLNTTGYIKLTHLPVAPPRSNGNK